MRWSGILRRYHHSSLVPVGNPKRKREYPPPSYTATTYSESTPSSYTPTTQEEITQEEITQEEIIQEGSSKTHRQVSLWQEEIPQEIT
jgi:hypothetical protein